MTKKQNELLKMSGNDFCEKFIKHYPLYILDACIDLIQQLRNEKVVKTFITDVAEIFRQYNFKVTKQSINYIISK